MRRPATPGPAPKSETAKRLEQIRERMRFPSLRSFHARLAEGWSKDDGRVTYEAARNYHFDREPTLAYLQRIAETFPEIRPEYLMTGDGPMLRSEERARRDAETDPRIDVARDRFWACLERSALYSLLEDSIDLRQQLGTLAFRIGIGALADEDEMGAAFEGLSRLLLQPFALLCPIRDEDGHMIVPHAYLRATMAAAHEAVDVALASLPHGQHEDLHRAVISDLITLEKDPTDA